MFDVLDGLRIWLVTSTKKDVAIANKTAGDEKKPVGKEKLDSSDISRFSNDNSHDSYPTRLQQDPEERKRKEI